MTDKPNGTSNGHDKDKNPDKVVEFPTLAERDRIRKKQQAAEKQEKKQQNGANEPFFNFGKIPPFTKTITAALILIHAAITFGLDKLTALELINKWGFIPSNFTAPESWNWLTLLTPITYNFIHSDWTHLGFNAIMCLALCTFVERMFSTKTTIRFFFLCGALGAAVFFVLNPTTESPVIGASGSISGLFAAALMMMYEQGRMGKFTGKLANKGPWPIIAIWAGIMIFIGMISGGSVAWEAHLGGFLAGAVLYSLMRTEKLRL